MDGARWGLSTTLGLKEHSTGHTHNGHMQQSCTYRDLCASFVAKHTSEFNGAEEETMNRKKMFMSREEEIVKEKEPKKKGQNGHDDLSVLEHLTC